MNVSKIWRNFNSFSTFLSFIQDWRNRILVVVLPLEIIEWDQKLNMTSVLESLSKSFVNGPSQIRNLCDGWGGSRQAVNQTPLVWGTLSTHAPKNTSRHQVQSSGCPRVPPYSEKIGDRDLPLPVPRFNEETINKDFLPFQFFAIARKTFCCSWVTVWHFWSRCVSTRLNLSGYIFFC